MAAAFLGDTDNHIAAMDLLLLFARRVLDKLSLRHYGTKCICRCGGGLTRSDVQLPPPRALVLTHPSLTPSASVVPFGRTGELRYVTLCWICPASAVCTPVVNEFLSHFFLPLPCPGINENFDPNALVTAVEEDPWILGTSPWRGCGVVYRHACPIAYCAMSRVVASLPHPFLRYVRCKGRRGRRGRGTQPRRRRCVRLLRGLPVQRADPPLLVRPFFLAFDGVCVAHAMFARTPTGVSHPQRVVDLSSYTCVFATGKRLMKEWRDTVPCAADSISIPLPSALNPPGTTPTTPAIL